MKSRQALIRQIADEHSFTIRQLYQWVATARGHYTIVGSAEQVADQLENWFRNEAADGFNILPPWLPGALDDFVDLVIPELQRRGLFRTAYEGPHAARESRPAAPRQPLDRRAHLRAGRRMILDPKEQDDEFAADRAAGRPRREAADPISAPRRLRRGGQAAGRFLSRYGVLLGFLALWQVRAAPGWINPAVFPPIDTIVAALWNGIAGGALLDDIAISLQRSGTAFVAAVLVAIPLGLFMGQVRAVETALDPILQLFRQTSALALYPVFILLLGLGETSKVFVIFWATLFPLLLEHHQRRQGGRSEADRDGARLWRVAADRVPPRRAARQRCRRSSSACGSPRPRRCCC